MRITLSKLRADIIATVLNENTAPQLLNGRQDIYKLESILGIGGMATVYRAFSLNSGKSYAIKLPNFAYSQFMNLRFIRESAIIKILKHPGIVRLQDIGKTDHQNFLVMEHIEGLHLCEYAEQHQLSLHLRLALFLELSGGVEHMHDQQVIHRDIKPSNVLTNQSGNPKLIDFGVANYLGSKNTELIQLGNTASYSPLSPIYASPEQIRGQVLDKTSDVYSMGTLLYRLLSNQPPFKPTRNIRRSIDSVLNKDPAKPSAAASGKRWNNWPLFYKKTKKEYLYYKPTSTLLKGRLDNIILQAMAKEKQNRYQSIGEFTNEILEWLQRGY